MVDNTTITAGSGTTIAADDIGAGVLAQRVKPVWGPDGTGNDIDVATGKPLPVQLRSATGLIPLGEPTDAANAATDTTSVSGISLWKQLSVYLKNLSDNVVALGRHSAATSMPIVPAYQVGQYVAASASATQLGTGSTTDYLDGLWIIPATAAAGAVSILWDGTNTRTVFAGGGTTALPTLAPFFVGLGFLSGNSGGFKVTTGTNVAVIAVGNF